MIIKTGRTSARAQVETENSKHNSTKTENKSHRYVESLHNPTCYMMKIIYSGTDGKSIEVNLRSKETTMPCDYIAIEYLGAII